MPRQLPDFDRKRASSPAQPRAAGGRGRGTLSHVYATVLSMKKRRRSGATQTFSVSVDPATKGKLKALAARKHGGNVSALITELALEGERQAAFERAWHWYGGREPTASESAAIRAEWEEGWNLARKPKKLRRTSAA